MKWKKFAPESEIKVHKKLKITRYIYISLIKNLVAYLNWTVEIWTRFRQTFPGKSKVLNTGCMPIEDFFLSWCLCLFGETHLRKTVLSVLFGRTTWLISISIAFKVIFQVHIYVACSSIHGYWKDHVLSMSPTLVDSFIAIHKGDYIRLQHYLNLAGVLRTECLEWILAAMMFT